MINMLKLRLLRVGLPVNVPRNYIQAATLLDLFWVTEMILLYKLQLMTVEQFYTS